MTELTKMFTVATNSDGDEDADTSLIFTDRTNREHISTEDMYQIVSNPLFQEIMGAGCVLVHLPDDVATLVATNDLENYAVRRMDKAKPGEKILVYNPKRSIQTIDLHEAYYSCTLPHKTIVGCSDCMSLKASRACSVKELSLHYNNEGDRWTPADVTYNLKSRKTQITDYTYVSPRLTAIESFAKTFRHIDDHDFSVVEDNSESIRQGLRERGRFRRFQKEVCPTCLIHKGCHKVQNERDIRWCNGPIALTEKEAVKLILDQYIIPFKPRELLYLALNSGELSQRYKRRKYWATFRTMTGYYAPNVLTFGLCRYTTGQFEAFSSFKEARKVLDKYGQGIPLENIRERHRLLTPLEKALLIELGCHHHSPVQRSRWHQTQYDALGLLYDNWRHEWELKFKFNSYGGKWSYRPCGLLLPWSICARNFNDIFEETTKLATLRRTDHPQNHYNFKRSR